MKHLFYLLFPFLGIATANAQEESMWPWSFTNDEGYKITLFQPTYESLEGNLLKARAAFSVFPPGSDEPVYGAMWAEAILLTNRDDRTFTLESVKVTQVRLPELNDEAKVEALKADVEENLLMLNIEGSIEELLAAVESVAQEQEQAEQLNTAPPKILYADEPTMLIIIDGEPRLMEDEENNVNRVVNTPSLIVQPDDKQFYLYGNGFWYKAPKATGPYAYIEKTPKSLKKVQKMIKEQEKEDKEVDRPEVTSPPKIVVSTEPAEIIVTDGKPEMATIEGSGLLYVKNTENELFMDVEGQQYYVLLSGRWYHSASVNGPWTYVASDQLPEDFAKIPEGSDKDGVLANVAGTKAALDAIMDAQVPQTAKVDRKNASATVNYDGQPQFESIENTSLQYAVNTASSVIRDGNNYYTVDNGVWFVSNSPNGPWQVATVRPQGIQNIPPDNPMYNVKYVYIYDVTPQYVYVGYTPGYLGTYVLGPTIVYGTGYYYNPWWGTVFYPRPCTWGFNMYYNPWTGWSFGFSWGWGWYRPWYRPWYGPGYGYGGWWGPPAYRPPHWHYHNRPYYGPRGSGVTINNNININRTNNIYNNRRDVITKDRRPTTQPSQPGRQPSTKPSTRPTQPSTRPSQPGRQPSTQPSTRPNTRENIYTDRSGNIYKQNPSNGNWQTRENNQWKTAPSNRAQNMDRTKSTQQRANTRQQNFNRSNQGGNMGRNYSRPQTRSAPRSAPRGGRRG